MAERPGILAAGLVAVGAIVALTVTPAVADPATRSSSPDIVERLEKSGKFTVLLQALETAGLDETLANEGPFTLFAPTDSAFAALLEDLDLSADQLLASPDLAKILLYHVVGGSLRAKELLGESTLSTLADNQPLLVVLEGSRIKVNRSNVVRGDIGASNGVIHSLDRVLLPPTSPVTIASLVDVLRLDGRFTVLLAALEATGLDDALAMGGPFTLFAPTDEAFAALLAELGITAEQLLADPGLSGILLYHAVEGRLKALDLLRQRSLRTLQGDEIEVRIRPGGIVVNDSRIRNPDVNAPNGMIHAIDEVLLP